MRSFLTLTALLALTGAAAAQPDDRPYLFISTSANEPAQGKPTAAVNNVTLRPNTGSAVYLYVRNPTDQGRTLKVVLAKGDGAGDTVGRADVTAPAKETVRVALTSTAAAPVAAAPGTPPAGP